MCRRKINEEMACKERMRKIIRIGPPDKMLDDLLYDVNNKQVIILVKRREDKFDNFKFRSEEDELFDKF
ncbi:MAG: hypothetical protein JJU28_17505 [Cyclobacteriaceae bacterium]|nr:hypothetical protein [Cyclobacteriaceae bacterium]